MKMREPEVRYASEFKCSRCGKPAVVFVGLNDPDGTDYPMCRKCADDWHTEILMAMHGMGEKMREPEAP